MEGPTGVFHSMDAHSPPTTAMTPARIANTAICSGVLENRLAIAATV